MTEQLQVFENQAFGLLEVLSVKGKSFFPRRSCAAALGYKNPHDAIAKHCRYLAKREVPHPRSPAKRIFRNFVPAGDLYCLDGTSEVALKAFLERNPQIRRVTLRLDNDRAGIIAARKIRAALASDQRYKHLHVTENPPHGVKDYNDLLLRAIQAEREEKICIHSRQRAAFS